MVGPAIARFLTAVALLVRARNSDDSEIVEMLQLGAALARAGSVGREAWSDLADKVRTMVDEGRGPTSLELSQLRETRMLLQDRALRVDLDAEPPTPPAATPPHNRSAESTGSPGAAMVPPPATDAPPPADPGDQKPPPDVPGDDDVPEAATGAYLSQSPGTDAPA